MVLTMGQEPLKRADFLLPASYRDDSNKSVNSNSCGLDGKQTNSNRVEY